MHNYIWCPYFLPSFMTFCSVVAEELCWQAASEVYFGKFLSSKGHNSHKIQAIKISWQCATPLKLLNRISLNVVGSKDTICSCAYYQEFLIAWILWEEELAKIWGRKKYNTTSSKLQSENHINIYKINNHNSHILYIHDQTHYWLDRHTFKYKLSRAKYQIYTR
jgi:hypothetical protein